MHQSGSIFPLFHTVWSWLQTVTGVFTQSSRVIPFPPETETSGGGRAGSPGSPGVQPCRHGNPQPHHWWALAVYQKALTFTLCLFYYSFCTFWLPFPQGPGCTGEMFLLREWEMAFLSISAVFTAVGEAQQRAGWNYCYQCQWNCCCRRSISQKWSNLGLC